MFDLFTRFRSRSLRLGRHYIDPVFGLGVIVGVILGAALSQLPCSGVLLLAAVLLVVAAMMSRKLGT